MKTPPMQLADISEATTITTLWFLLVTIRFPQAAIEHSLKRENGKWDCVLHVVDVDGRAIYEGVARADGPLEAVHGAMLVAGMMPSNEAVAINNLLKAERQPRGLLGAALGISRA